MQVKDKAFDLFFSQLKKEAERKILLSEILIAAMIILSVCVPKFGFFFGVIAGYHLKRALDQQKHITDSRRRLNEIFDLTNTTNGEEKMESKMNFGAALEALKNGLRVAREGWNGKGMYVTYKPGYPDGITANEATRKAHNLNEGATIVYRPYLEMKTADGSLVPWLASQTDLLAEDWAKV